MRTCDAAPSTGRGPDDWPVDPEPGFGGLLLGLFFAAIGMSLNVGLLAIEPVGIAGLVAVSRGAAYHAAKFGLQGLSESLRAEYGKHGIGVTALCPGFVHTGMFESAMNDCGARGMRCRGGGRPRWSPPSEPAPSIRLNSQKSNCARSRSATFSRS